VIERGLWATWATWATWAMVKSKKLAKVDVSATRSWILMPSHPYPALPTHYYLIMITDEINYNGDACGESVCVN